MSKETTNKEELLKAVADVLDEALQEYEKLAKMDNLELAEDPSRPMIPAGDASQEVPEGKKKDGEEDEDEDEEDEDEDKKKEGEEEDMDDEAMKSEYAKFTAKMESRGLLNKTEAKVEAVKKSEAATVVEDKTDSLKKSVDERFDALTKTITDIADKVNKIASAPARKGVAGYQPLRKSEEGSEVQPLNKAEIVGKLLDLKKSGKYVDTALINRIETGRTSQADAQTVKQLLG